MGEDLTGTGGGVSIVVIAEENDEELVDGRQGLPSCRTTMGRVREADTHTHKGSVPLQTHCLTSQIKYICTYSV